ncbi:MAG TPA: ATP-binding cassette domain-containing protein [Thermoanaerobaculia bacterium]|nr:ATP-binding cassette domain-containing protein [Thermoanaerobaculia bacterium]
MAFGELRRLTRSFDRTKAVAGIDLDFEPGEAIALVGENGAGKTTLMRMLAGIIPPDDGTITVGGERVRGTASASAARIEMVQQHLNLAGALTAAENLILHDENLPLLLTGKRVGALARSAVSRSGLRFTKLQERAGDLSVGEASRLELIRTLARGPQVLILDEPTAVLAPPEVLELTRQLRALTAEGMTVILISHKLAEVFAFASRVVVLRNGALVLDAPIGQTSKSSVAVAMMGRELVSPGTRKATIPRRPRLRLDRVSTSARDHRTPLREVSLEVGSGEITAIVGVAGNGQNALADLLRGLIEPAGGTVAIDGVIQTARSLFAAETAAHVPSDRARDGIIAAMSVAENLRLPGRAEARIPVDQAIERYAIRGAASQSASSLSGGNQQKVLLARELSRDPLLIVASEPTRGLDIDAAAFVHREFRAAADRGATVLIITSDLDEAASLGDSIHVISGGMVSEKLASSTPAEQLGLLMAGDR